MSGGGGNTTTKTELPDYAKPYAVDLLERSGQLSDQQIPVYQGQRTADMNQYQTGAMDMTAARALGGSQEINAGSRNITDTLNGKYLDGNPYLQNQIDQSSGAITRNFQQAIQPSTDANFARAGAFGGSAWGQASDNNSRNLASALQNNATQMQYQNYGDERNRQRGAMPLALNYGNQAYTDASALGQVGQQQYGFDQQRLDDYMAMWNDIVQGPYKQLDILANGLRGSVGGGGTVTASGPSANPWGQALGAGAALYGALK